MEERYNNVVSYATKIQKELNELKKRLAKYKLTSKNKNILRMPIPNTNLCGANLTPNPFGTNFTPNSFGTDFTPNHLTEEETIEALRQAYQTIAKKKRSKNKWNTSHWKADQSLEMT